jgi:hypothetical protein
MKNQKNTTNNNLTDNSNFILYNSANYKSSIENSISEILNKFVSVIVEYMRFISDKIVMKNKNYYTFIFEKGIETIIHVFTIIFYYTKNLELTFYHTQKAYYFYTEFIEQISNDNINFLKLNSRDAIMFVYKKTIFDISNEYKKNIQEPTNDEKKILSIFETYTNIYKSIVLFILNNNNFNYDNKIEYINICCSSIEITSMTLNKNKVKPTHIQYIHLFIKLLNTKLLNTKLLNDKNIEVVDFFKLLDEFIKTIITKKKFDELIIMNNIHNIDIDNCIVNNELNNIVNTIFSY